MVLEILTFMGTVTVAYIQYRDHRTAHKEEQEDKKTEDLKAVNDTLKAYGQRLDVLERTAAETEDVNRSSEIKMNFMCSLLVEMAHDRLYYSGKKYSRRGCITLDEQGIIASMYKPYSVLGGNGTGKSAYNTCMTLPVVPDDVAEECDRKGMNYSDYQIEHEILQKRRTNNG